MTTNRRAKQGRSGFSPKHKGTRPIPVRSARRGARRVSHKQLAVVAAATTLQ